MSFYIWPVYDKDLPKEVRTSLKKYAFIKDKALAAALTIEETGHLIGWCGYQDGNLWEGMCLQEILNIYRISAVYENFEAWAQEEGNVARRAWNKAVRPKNRLRIRRL